MTAAEQEIVEALNRAIIAREAVIYALMKALTEAVETLEFAVRGQKVAKDPGVKAALDKVMTSINSLPRLKA
jgi:hypothetical protein